MERNTFEIKKKIPSTVLNFLNILLQMTGKREFSETLSSPRNVSSIWEPFSLCCARTEVRTMSLELHVIV